MNLNHLEYFITLAEVQHFTKAAEMLYITQPSLTYAISSLEEKLGLKLFEKNGRNVVLTQSGQIFLDEITNSVLQLNAAFKKMDLLRQGSGLIRIGSVRVLTRSLVPSLAHHFKELNPHLDIKYTFSTSTGMSSDIINEIKNRELDVGFSSYISNEPEVAFHPVYEQNMVIIVPMDHPLAKYDELEISSLKDFPIIMFNESSGLNNIIMDMFRHAQIEPNIVYSASEDETVAGLVAANFGIAIVPSMHILKLLPLKVITIANSKIRRLFYLAYLENSYKLPVVNKFIDYVLENYEID